MATYRLALKSPRQADPKLLVEAQSWAENALGDAQPVDGAAAPGHDKNNILAHFVLGLAHEAQGVLQTKDKPGDLEKHKEAKKHFDIAKSHLSRVLELAKERGGKEGALPRLAQEAQEGAQRLENSAFFLTKASELSGQGKVQEAWTQLSEGIQRHPILELWLARAEAGRRARMESSLLLSELDGAVSGGVLPKNDYRASLVRAKLSLRGILVYDLPIGNCSAAGRSPWPSCQGCSGRRSIIARSCRRRQCRR